MFCKLVARNFVKIFKLKLNFVLTFIFEMRNNRKLIHSENEQYDL